MISYFDRAVNQAVQLLTFEDAPDPERVRQISSLAARMISELAGETLNAESVARAVETRCNVFVEKPAVLLDAANHVEWLAARRPSIDWRFWDRYRRYLAEVVGLGPRVVDRLDGVTDMVLGLMEDPRRESSWDTRGLVVGQVQSGKTGNYTGLICKAADVGYTLIVVLAGVHNSLRSQTQLRLDQGFVGFDTQRRRLFSRDNPKLGVGALADSQLLPVHALTDSGDTGDFGLRFSKQANINIRGSDPILLVVKKNASILRNLMTWLTWLARADSSGRPVVSDVPLLLIDDEADHASVNTAKTEEDDPTRINGLIRRLLQSFEKSCYIGYTATPFANIYIDDRVSDARFGQDLFPRSFIIGLRAPSNYMGPERVFGLLPDPAIDAPASAGVPIVRYVDDHATWLPDRHRANDEPGDELPDSVVKALHSFVLVCAARAARGQLGRHNSMLVHVTRYVRVQEMVAEQVAAYMRSVHARLRYGDGARRDRLQDELRTLWDEDFEPTTASMDGEPLSWSQVREHLVTAASSIQVMRINGTAKNDVLSYIEHEDTGLSVIAIGGDKLSRGLTLEGLSVSYYLRATRMYDTLLQMGRWFGYRPGYEDLCRLYTTGQLASWYQQITLADVELRQEFDEMVARHATPRDYGLRIRDHPDGLLITAPSKMRSGQTIQLDYSATVSETVTFETGDTQTNFNATEALLRRLGSPGEDRRRRYVWRGATADLIVNFLAEYRTADRWATKVRADILAEYIRERVRADELTAWTVALIAGGSTDTTDEIAGLTVSLTFRDWIQDTLTIKRLLSPSDEAIDLSEEEMAAARDPVGRNADADQTASKRPGGPAIRRARPPERGLLLIYPLEGPEKETVIGFGISFPESGDRSRRTIAYKINQVMFRQLFLDLFDSEDGLD